MFCAFQKCLLIPILIICCSSCFGKEDLVEHLLLAIRKINSDQFNLTCILEGNVANEGLSLTGPEQSQNFQKTNNIPNHYVKLNGTPIYMNLPPVLDQQWEEFPIQGLDKTISILKNEYLWISVRCKEDLIIRNKNDSIYIKETCEDNKRWLHLHLHSNATHLSVKSGMSAVEDNLMYTNKDMDKRNLTLNSYFKEHRYKGEITENSNKTSDKYMKIKIGKPYTNFIILSYHFICSSCNATLKLEDSMGEKCSNILYFVRNGSKWNTGDLTIDQDAINNNSTLLEGVIHVKPANNESFTLVIRNMFFHRNIMDSSISTLVNSTDISKYICENIDSNITARLGSIKSNHTKKEVRFPQSILCYSDGNCFCSAGSHGDVCDKSCGTGYWGNCFMECECCNVNNVCDEIDGSCGMADDCAKSRSVESVSLNSSSTSVMGKVNIDTSILQKKINSIKIEYMEAANESKKGKWKFHNYLESLIDLRFNITNLEPNMNYSIRTLLCTERSCFTEYAKISNITTICDKPVPSELNLTIGHDNVLLTSSNYSSKNGSCPDLLSISTDKRQNKNKIIGLIPYTDYNVDILFQGERIDSKRIRTKTTKASAVRSLQFNESRSLISWNEPNYLNGNLKFYFVNITRLGSILCDNITSIQSETKDMQLPLKAIPYSEYEVIVQASNEEGRGVVGKTKFRSSPTNKIDQNERPIKFDINETHLDIEIYGCSMISGPWLIYESTFTCLDPECENEQLISTVNVSYTVEFKYVLPLVLPKPLEPYKNYTVITRIYRDKEASITLINTTNISTAPQCPSPVRHLELYSRSNSSISVRWKRPYPRRGILENIIFQFKGAKEKIKYKQLKNCFLWDDTDYFCKTFENLTDDSFPINVIAKNFNTTKCDANSTITKTPLQESESEAPKHLKATWKGDMEELELTWKHPNKTNGRLKGFNIILKSRTNESKDIFQVFNIFNESHYYNYSIIIKTFNYSTKYSVDVVPINTVPGMPAKLADEIVTPPPYPVIDKNTKYTLHGNYCTVHIPSIRNWTGNSSIRVIISNGNCDSVFATNTNVIGRKDVDVQRDVFNNSIKIDLVKDFNINNISIYKDYSIIIFVISRFENISRNSSLCLTEIPIHLATTSSVIYLWVVGLFALMVLLLVLCVIYNYKYGLFKCSGISSLKIFQRRKQNDACRSSRRTSIDSECIELKLKVKVLYENNPLIVKSRSIQTKIFLKYLKSAVEYGDECELYTDFDSIPLKMYNYGDISIKNKTKNRYINILPYESNRVILKSGRYINASFIQGYKTERAYIATQGPKYETVDDFWEMIFEYNVNLIAMLCPLKEDSKVKCDQYWPDFQIKTINSRNLEIEFDKENYFGVFIERHFIITCDTVQRKAIQLQFTAWMDHKIPRSSQFLYEFLERFHTLHDYNNPAVVHCSAGSGRTGTLILCDYLVRMSKHISALDFLLVLCNLRKERIQMIQTKEQYHFAHIVIYEYLCIGKNHIACDKNFEKNVLKIIESKQMIQKQIQSLKNLYAVDVATFKEKNIRMEAEDVAKNRDENILPTYSGIIYLQPTANRVHSTYINAIHVDGYNQPEKFIVTQQPLISSHGSTIADFWKLVIQTKPEVIVSLQDQVINFYPTENELLVDNCIKLKCISKSGNDTSTIFTVKLIMDYEDFTIKIMTPNVKLEANTDGLHNFIEFCKEYRNNYSHKEFTVLVTCINGCELSGVFVALDYTVEKMLQQDICDVYLAIRTVKRTRPNFITTEKQFRFLYQCAIEIRKSMCSI